MGMGAASKLVLSAFCRLKYCPSPRDTRANALRWSTRGENGGQNSQKNNDSGHDEAGRIIPGNHKASLSWVGCWGASAMEAAIHAADTGSGCPMALLAATQQYADW